jgi:hypothetical protein
VGVGVGVGPVAAFASYLSGMAVSRLSRSVAAVPFLLGRHSGLGDADGAGESGGSGAAGDELQRPVSRDYGSGGGDAALDSLQWQQLYGTREKPFNFASDDAGARVLAASVSAVGSKKVLNSNPDQYMLVPCAGDGVGGSRWIDIELSEEVVVSSFETGNFEFYSSFPRRIAVLGSTSYPPKRWNTLALFDFASVRTMQRFTIPNRAVTRYLRVIFAGRQGNERYCPISVVRVFGKTLIADWKDALEGSPAPDGGVAAVSPEQLPFGDGGVADGVEAAIAHPASPELAGASPLPPPPAGAVDTGFRPTVLPVVGGQDPSGQPDSAISAAASSSAAGKSGGDAARSAPSLPPASAEPPSSAATVGSRVDDDGDSDVDNATALEDEARRVYMPVDGSEGTVASRAPPTLPSGTAETVVSQNTLKAGADANVVDNTHGPDADCASSVLPEAMRVAGSDAYAKATEQSHAIAGTLDGNPANELSEEDMKVLSAVREEALSPFSSEENVFRKVTRMIRLLELNQSLTNQYIDTHLARYAQALSAARAEAGHVKEEAALTRSYLTGLTSSTQASLDQMAAASFKRDVLICVLLILVAILIGSHCVLWSALSGVAELYSAVNADSRHVQPVESQKIGTNAPLSLAEAAESHALEIVDGVNGASPIQQNGKGKRRKSSGSRLRRPVGIPSGPSPQKGIGNNFRSDSLPVLPATSPRLSLPFERYSPDSPLTSPSHGLFSKSSSGKTADLSRSNTSSSSPPDGVALVLPESRANLMFRSNPLGVPVQDEVVQRRGGAGAAAGEGILRSRSFGVESTTAAGSAKQPKSSKVYGK